MNPRQNAMYWAEWAKLRDALRAKGKSVTQIEHYRHELTVRALGVEKSSKKFTNVDLDKVLARIRAEREPGNLDAQLAIQESPEKRRAYLLARCDECCGEMWSRGNDNRLLKPEMRLRYVAGTARNVIGKELEDCSAEEIAKVLGCLEARLRRLIARGDAKVAAARANPVSVRPQDDGNPF